MALSHGLENLP